MNTYAKYFGIGLLAVGAILLLTLAYRNSSRRYVSPLFSPTATLANLWNGYRTDYIEPNTFRTLDRQQDNITTSEGQSYTMLRAVWQDDRATFDGAWQWTKDNLQHSEDALFSWLFGQRTDGTYGVLTERGGQNAASDADADIALALLFAAARWNEPQYRTEATQIIQSIWEREVLLVGNTPYLAANDIERLSPGPYVMNPSYCAPYAYRIFAEVDPAHPWLTLVDSCYELLERSMQAPLDAATSVGLPPNWVLLGTDRSILPPRAPQTTDFGYDAIRTPFRLALDHYWFAEPRVAQLLGRMSYLSRQWQEHTMLAAVYAHDGTPKEQFEVPAVYGGTIGYFRIADPESAEAVFRLKLQSLYNPDTMRWKQPLSYYDANLAWFGIALYYNSLPNLFAEEHP